LADTSESGMAKSSGWLEKTPTGAGAVPV
jgi:hypothetical protein